MKKAIWAVKSERIRQEMKWGEQNHEPIIWLGILGEEFGELAQAITETIFGGKEGGHDNIRNEAVQVAAVAVQFIEYLDRRKASE